MNSLTAYVIGTVIVWLIILAVVWTAAHSHFQLILRLSAMFYIGMLAMYLAQHIYPFHPWR